MEKLPKILYKYRVWKDEKDKKDSYKFHRELLTKRRIYFSSPKDFNDPFDSKIYFEFDFSDKKKAVKKIIDFYKRESPNINSKERKKLASKKLRELIFKKDDRVSFLDSQLDETIKNSYGVYSLSENKGSILMWSHYSFSHKGFCVGLCPKIINEHRNNFYKRKSNFYLIQEVEYKKEYPKLNYYDSSIDEFHNFLNIVLTTKFIDWQYEQEYRLVLYLSAENYENNKILTNGQRRDTLPKSAFKEVILGCEMCDEHKEEIKKVLRKENFEVDLYQAKMKDRSFGLDFEQINY